MEQEVNKIKYILYARKSSEAEDRQVTSIEAQVKELKRIAKRNNLKISYVLEESQSAKRKGRPVFNEMIRKIENKEASGILCWKLDRLARNPKDGGQINSMLQDGIIQQIQTYEKVYLPTDNVLMMYVELGMANQFIRDLSVNVKRGLKAKAEKGWYPTFATIGYIHNPSKQKGEKEIIKDSERFYLVRKIFDLILSGKYSPPKALDIANKEWGLTTKKGNKVARSAVYRILKDPFYYGVFEYPKHSGNWYQGKHEPMITKDEYDKIQSLLFGKKMTNKQEKIFPFRGPIRCGECGATITAENKTKKQKNGNIHDYIYYHCTKRKIPNCSQKSIEEEKLKEQIVGKLKKIEIPPEFHLWATKWLKKEIEKDSSDRNKIIAKQQKEYGNCLKEIDGIISMRAKGELEEEDYKRRKKFLEEDKIRLRELITDIDDTVMKRIEKAEKTFSFARDAREEFESDDPDKQKNILIGLGSNLLLKDKELTFLEEKALFCMERLAFEVQAVHNKVRTSENGQNKAKIEDFYEKSPKLLRR